MVGGGGGGTTACSVSGGTTKVGSPSNVCNLCSSGNIATGGKYISLGSRGKRYEGSCTRLMYSDQNSNAQFCGNGDLNYGGGGGGGGVNNGGAGGSSFCLKSVCLTYTYSVSDFATCDFRLNMYQLRKFLLWKRRFSVYQL